MTLRKATRQKSKIRLGLSAVSGGGKTYSAILIAKGLMNGKLDKVALIDTENGSGDLYSHLGDYNVLPLEAPYTPENYAKAIKLCEDAGMEVIIIDSITHEWDGKGGILEIHSAMTGNSFTNWASLTPRHQKFIDAILQSKAHIITTVRRKQDYEMSKDGNGKMVIEKAGLKEVTREGFEYELTVNLNLDMAHMATALKDRSGLFIDQPPFIPSEATGKMILDWCENGVEPIKFDAEKELKSAKNLIDLGAVWQSLTKEDQVKYVGVKDEMKTKLTSTVIVDTPAEKKKTEPRNNLTTTKK
jgi:hypothetical protein